MPTRKITDLFAERAKPPARGQIDYFDAAFPALSLRVTENGGKSWCLFYRFNGRLRRFTLGRYPAIKPAQARREAGAALEKVREGRDPGEEKRTRRDQRTPETEAFGGRPRLSRIAPQAEQPRVHLPGSKARFRTRRAAALGEAADREHQPARRHSTC